MDLPKTIRPTFAHASFRDRPPKNAIINGAITLIRQRGKFLGYIAAPERETAIKEAIKQFSITDAEQQRRLIAQCSD